MPRIILKPLIGRMLMKLLAKAFTILLGICLVASTASAQTATGLSTQISNLKASIEAQIEQIKAARSSSDSQIELARLRIGQQIQKSEEDLAIQMEQLQRLRDQLQQQKDQANQTVSSMQNDLSVISTVSLSSIEDQLSRTSDLLNRMRQTYEQVTGETDPTSSSSLAVKSSNALSATPQTSMTSSSPATSSTTTTTMTSSCPYSQPPTVETTSSGTPDGTTEMDPTLPGLSIQPETTIAQPETDQPTTTQSAPSTSATPAVFPTPAPGGS